MKTERQLAQELIKLIKSQQPKFSVSNGSIQANINGEIVSIPLNNRLVEKEEVSSLR